MPGQPKAKIRILLVDDSYFVKKILREIVHQEKDMEVVGEAKDGIEAVGEALRLRPDVITMDYNMPKMTGAEAVRKILSAKTEKSPAIIMLSAYTKEGAQETLASLRAGAVDFITKPSGELSLDLNLVAREMTAKIRMASQAQVQRYTRLQTASGEKHCGRTSFQKIVAIGSSSGGPPVVEDILSSLSTDFSAPVLVAQHMPKYFTQRFAERLNTLSPLGIKEAEDGDLLRAGTVYVAPGDYPRLLVAQQRQEGQREYLIHLKQDPHFQGASPSIDCLMRAVAQRGGNRAIGVILSGMGTDGAAGMRAIKAAGGHTIVQDPASAVISAMPLAVIAEGAADEILPPAQIGPKLNTLCSA